MSMESVERCFRQIAGAVVRPEPGEILVLVPAAHGYVHVCIQSNGLSLHVPFPERPALAQPTIGSNAYRDHARAVVKTLRPMRIRLRTETERDAQLVSSGVAREFRSGDAEFDQAIYIDTECEDAVLHAVLNEEVRGAVLTLCRLRIPGLSPAHLTIDDDRGRSIAEWSMPARRGSVDLTDEQALKMVEAMDALSSALPPVTSAGRRPARSTVESLVRAVQVVVVVVFSASPIWLYGIAGRGQLDTDFAVRACLVAAGLAIVQCGLIMRFIRGRSSSPETRSTAVAVAMWLSLDLGVLVAWLLR